jgi:hypothetical protein
MKILHDTDHVEIILSPEGDLFTDYIRCIEKFGSRLVDNDT